MLGKEKIVFDPANAAETDNIGAYITAADGVLITHTTVTGKDGLDVYLINPNIEVTQGTSPWVIGDGGGSITVDAVNLDIRDLAFATDSVDVSGSSVSITGDVNVTQGTSPWVVSATDLDIRDLSHTQDSIKIGDGTDFLAINADGSINVNADISVVNGHEKAEDAASANGDIGSYVLSVRQDTLASSTSADGDYQSFKTDSVGALWAHISAIPQAPADDTLANAAATVGTSAAAITASLATRRKMIVQNVDNSKPIYLGNASVTTANGLRLTAGSALEIELAAGTSLYAIAGTAGVLARVLETGHA